VEKIGMRITELLNKQLSYVESSEFETQKDGTPDQEEGTVYGNCLLSFLKKFKNGGKRGGSARRRRDLTQEGGEKEEMLEQKIVNFAVWGHRTSAHTGQNAISRGFRVQEGRRDVKMIVLWGINESENEESVTKAGGGVRTSP